jgi:hypothetical protein
MECSHRHKSVNTVEIMLKCICKDHLIKGVGQSFYTKAFFKARYEMCTSINNNKSIKIQSTTYLQITVAHG